MVCYRVITNETNFKLLADIFMKFLLIRSKVTGGEHEALSEYYSWLDLNSSCTTHMTYI